MKISKTTIEILKNFSGINPSILVKPGSVLKTISPQKTIVAQAVTKEHFNEEFCIYELNKFIQALNLYSEPDVEFGENSCVISQGNSRVVYVYADPTMIVSIDKDIKQPTPTASFNISEEVLERTLKAVGILQLPEISLKSTDGKMIFGGVNTKNTSSDLFEVNVETEYSGDDFEVILKVENFSKLMKRSYECNVITSPRPAITFVADDLFYIMAIEENSKV